MVVTEDTFITALTTLTDSNKLLNSFLKDCPICIVDASGGARARLAGLLIDLGASSSKIETFTRLDYAKDNFSKQQPKLVFTDARVGKSSGFQFIQDLRREFPQNKSTIFIMISANCSQSVVAKAAEEDIDAFIIKPFTIDLVVRTLATAINNKLYPSEYMQLINRGKEFLMSGNYAESIDIFDRAMRLSQSPTLACFYKGQAQYLLEKIENAQAEYRHGLEHNKIHYKCLVGLYDLLFNQSLFDEAYDVVRTIAEYFPANPERLAKILWLAIVTKNYLDVEDYYQFFKDMDERPDELVRHLCAAMLICGKFLIRSNMKDRAFDLFEKVGATATAHPQFLRILIEYMTEFELPEYYPQFMKRFSVDQYQLDDFKISEFLSKHHLLKPIEVYKMSNDLIRANLQSSAIYFVLIKSLHKLGRSDDAQACLKHALDAFPEKTSILQKLGNQLLG